MKKSGNIFTILGILVAIYSIIEKFAGKPTINIGAIDIDAISGIIMACFLMLLGISLKLWDK